MTSLNVLFGGFNKKGAHLVEIFCTRNNKHFANQGHRVSSMDFLSWENLN